MQKTTHWLLAPTEDDKFCVKGGAQQLQGRIDLA